jgi:hypothetical protein
MAKVNTRWTVLPHGPIQEESENLWTVRAPLPDMPLGRVMSIARMSDGRLVVHNGIALEAASMLAIEGWGTPAFLLVPNGWHRLDAPAYKARYPALRVLCPEGARKTVGEVVTVDGTYEDFPSDPDVAVTYLEGVKRREGFVEVRSRDGVSLVFNDVIFNQPHLPGMNGFVMRLLGSTGGPRVTRIGKLFLVKDRAALRAHLERLATLPDLRRIVIMHGASVSDGGRAAELLRQVAAGL